MKEAEKLLEKHKAGLCTPEEVQLLKKWFHHLGEAEVSELNAEDLIVAKLKFERNVNEVIVPSPIDEHYPAYKLWPREAAISTTWKIAAAIAAITLGVWFFSAQYMNGRQIGGRHPEFISGSQNITPGRNTATLTFANGKTIHLSEAKTGIVIDKHKLAYNDSSLVQDGALSVGGQKQFTVRTPRGGTYQVTLPDGTKVWLNAASSLTYTPPVNKSSTSSSISSSSSSSSSSSVTRKVTLIGEAYFEVFHNKKQPFVVNSKRMELTVLGTHFNVSAYNDEIATKATLFEGSVSVRHPGAGRHPDAVAILTPNHQALLKGDENIAVKQVDPIDAIAWKNGDFVFKEEPIESIMRSIARWYNIKVIYNDQINDERFTGTVSRNKNITEVLYMLEKAKGVHFKIEGKTVYVSR